MTPRPHDEVQRLVGDLADQAPLRRATSAEEAAGAALVNILLRRAGLRVSTRQLRAARQRRGQYVPLALLGLAAAALAPWSAPLGAGLALCLLLLLLIDGAIAPLPIVGPRSASQNIVGTREIERPDGAGAAPPPRWRVLLLAPLDTPTELRGLARLSGATRRAQLGRLAIPALAALSALASARLPALSWLLAGAAALLALLLLIGATRPADLSAHDSGLGALAALVLAARRLSGLRRVELWVVGVGAASGDTVGADLLAALPFQAADSLVIGVEQITAGQLIYTTREGGLRSRPAGALPLRLAADADAADPLIDAEPRPYRADDSLIAPLRRRGLAGLTIRSQPDIGLPPAESRPDPQLIERAARLIEGVVRQLEGRKDEG